MTAPVREAESDGRTTVHRRPLSFGRFVAGARARGHSSYSPAWASPTPR